MLATIATIYGQINSAYPVPDVIFGPRIETMYQWSPVLFALKLDVKVFVPALLYLTVCVDDAPDFVLRWYVTVTGPVT